MLRSNGSCGVRCVGGVVHVRGLNDLLHGVHVVGCRNSNGTRNSNLIGPCNVLGYDNLALDSNGNVDGNINVVVLHVDLGDDVRLLGSNARVRAHGSNNPLLGDSISRSWAISNVRRREGGEIGGRSRNCRQSKRACFNERLRSSGDETSGWLRNVFNTGNGVLMSTNNGNCSGLNHLTSNYAILDTLFNNGRSSSVGLVGLSNNLGRVGNCSTMGYCRACSICAGSVASNWRTSNKMA